MQDVATVTSVPESLRRLDPLAELMILDTRPEYPMGFFVECGCEGNLDRERLDKALRVVAQRHPNVTSHVVWRAGRPFWKATTQAPELIWDPHPTTVDPWRPFDLNREIGLRLVVFPLTPQGESILKWKLVLFGHHAVCDGLAVCELLGEIWANYADRPLPPLDYCQSNTLESSPGPQSAVAVTEDETPIAQRLSAVLAEALRFLVFFPSKLARNPVISQKETSTKESNPAISIGHWSDVEVSNPPPYRLLAFTSDQIALLRKACEARNVTLNTLMLAASMRVFADWNYEATGSHRGTRITMPVSLRHDTIRRPAENRIGYAFLDRTFAACGHEETLMQTLSEASSWIKESGAAGMFINAIAVLGKIPGLLWLILRLPVCFSTAVVSNLGDAARCMRMDTPGSGRAKIARDAVITHVVGVPPVRPRTGASVGIARYDDRLYVACLADERTLGPAAAERLLAKIYAECLDLASKS